MHRFLFAQMRVGGRTEGILIAASERVTGEAPVQVIQAPRRAAPGNCFRSHCHGDEATERLGSGY